MYTHTHTHTHTYIYIYIYTHTYIYIYIYIYRYIHTTTLYYWPNTTGMTHRKISLSIFSWVFPFFLSLPVLEWRFLGILSSSILSRWPNQLIFALLSILLYFILSSSLLVLDSSDFSIPRFHNKIITIMKNFLLKMQVPLQAWSGPEGSRKLRFPDFMTTAQDGGKGVRLTHWPPLPPGNAPGTHFC